MFPPEGVPSLDMLLETDICEHDEAEESEADDDDNDCDTAVDAMGSERGQAATDVDDVDNDHVAGEGSEIDDTSSDGDSDADNGMGRKAGAVRVMVESFADRCVVISAGKSINLKSLPSESRWAGWCPGCRRALAVGVRRQLLHEMNATVAIADCRGCSVIDVLPSTFIISCSSCSAPVVLPDRQHRARRYNVVSCSKAHHCRDHPAY